jgi:uncharacterized RmlC-like cupin family protein
MGHGQHTAGDSNIAVVQAQELNTEKTQTQGSIEPSARTGIHHHGEQDIVVCVLGSEAFVRWAMRDEHSALHSIK